MFKVTLLLLCCLLLPYQRAQAQSSGGHGDHGGGGGQGGMSCQKLRINKNKLVPEPLSEVAPGSEISFLAFGVDTPDHLEVSVKKIPIEITTEFKDTFYIVKGNLPADLKGTPARINVKFKAKNPKCNGEEGWLVKITE
ncbi:MAG: hypothetical protein ACU85E_10590 [Gammaproteobacteria bacterium]